MRVTKNKIYEVYLAVNLVTGDRYIGASSKGMCQRQKEHIDAAKSGRNGCRRFSRALRKYGANSFVWKVLVECVSFELMMEKEIELIAKFKPEYNLTRGGQGIVGLKRTKRWRERVSKALSGKKFSPERIAKMRRLDHSYAYKPVVCLDENKWFRSVKSAAKYYNINSSRITEVLSGRQYKTKDHYFIFSKRRLNRTDALLRLLKIKEKALVSKSQCSKNRWRSVICLTDGQQYPTLTAAAKEYNTKIGLVMLACQTGVRSNGHYFRYTDQTGFPKRKVLPPEECERRQAAARQKLIERTKKPVIVVETGQQFESIRAAADALGINRGTLYAAIDFNRRCCGLTIRLLDSVIPKQAA